MQRTHRCWDGRCSHGRCLNPFHSWWWHAWRWIAAPARLAGFAPMLVACRWTRTRCRIGLGFVGWSMEGLRDRWGGSLLPSVRIFRDDYIERWDSQGSGPGWNISFEGFGFSFSLIVGRTPRRDR